MESNRELTSCNCKICFKKISTTCIYQQEQRGAPNVSLCSSKPCKCPIGFPNLTQINYPYKIIQKTLQPRFFPITRFILFPEQLIQQYDTKTSKICTQYTQPYNCHALSWTNMGWLTISLLHWNLIFHCATIRYHMYNSKAYFVLGSTECMIVRPCHTNSMGNPNNSPLMIFLMRSRIHFNFKL